MQNNQSAALNPFEAFASGGLSQPSGNPAQDFVYGMAPYSQMAQGNTLGASTTNNTPSPNVTNALNTYYDNLISGYQTQLGLLDPQRQAAQGQIVNQYNTAYNPLQRDYALGQSQLSQASDTVNKQRAQSLQQIADQVKSQVAGYNNQLGTYGAGNSSASDLLKVALGRSASGNRQNVLQNASGQEQAVQQQTQALQNSFNDNLQKLDQWKNSQLSDLAIKFSSEQSRLQQAMAGASAERISQLAQAGQATAQQYLDQLANIQATVKQGATDLANLYNNSLRPQEYQLNQDQLNYTVAPISASQLNQLRMPQQVNPETAAALPFLRRLNEQVQPALGV